MRISLPTLFAGALAIVSASCTEPYASSRLAPVGVPRSVGLAEARDPDAATGRRAVGTVPVEAGTGSSTSPAAAEASGALAPVPPARVTEADVGPYLRALGDQFGDAGLRRLQPGSTLVERLRYCTSRIGLGQSKSVLAELERLSRFHSDNPMVWRQLAVARRTLDMGDEAVVAARRGHQLAAAGGFTVCPSMPSILGQLLLASPEAQDEGIRMLRNELADGADHVNASQVLADFLCSRERHEQALAALSRSLVREPSNELVQLRRIEVLNDLHRPYQALAALRPLLAAEPVSLRALQARLFAQLLRVDLEAAIGAIDAMLALDRLGERYRAMLVEKREQLVASMKSGREPGYESWQVLAILRGHPELIRRRRILRSLLGQGPKGLIEPALTVAVNSDSPVLRADALRLLMPISRAPVEHLRQGLADPDSRVRGIAASLAGEVEGNPTERRALLLDALTKETNAYAFGQLHESLVKLTGEKIDLPFGAAADPDQRRAIANRWRRVQ